MSQWGDARTINGVTIAPLVQTALWARIRPQMDKIEELRIVNIDPALSSRGQATATLSEAERFVGRPYASWLELPRPILMR